MIYIYIYYFGQTFFVHGQYRMRKRARLEVGFESENGRSEVHCEDPFTKCGVPWSTAYLLLPLTSAARQPLQMMSDRNTKAFHSGWVWSSVEFKPHICTPCAVLLPRKARANRTLSTRIAWQPHWTLLKMRMSRKPIIVKWNVQTSFWLISYFS